MLRDLAKGERSAGGEETFGVVSNVPCPLGGFFKGHISCYWEDLFLYLGKKNCQAGSCTSESQFSSFFPSPEQGKSAGVRLSSCLRNEAVLSLRNGLWRAKQRPALSIVHSPGLTSGVCNGPRQEEKRELKPLFLDQDKILVADFTELFALRHCEGLDPDS